MPMPISAQTRKALKWSAKTLNVSRIVALHHCQLRDGPTSLAAEVQPILFNPGLRHDFFCRKSANESACEVSAHQLPWHFAMKGVQKCLQGAKPGKVW